MQPLLELAVFGQEAALVAGLAGVDRMELCVDYAQGGLTPGPELTASVTSASSCPVFVMIRPRGGDFCYTLEERFQMERELAMAKQCGASGFVFGILQNDGQIDEAANTALVTLARPLPCTFHRAFDDLEDKGAGLEALIRCGFRRVLTSGGRGGAPSNAGTLKALVMQAAGRIIVMPGGGIRPSNLGALAKTTGAAEFHSAAITGSGALPDKQAISEMKQILQDVWPVREGP